MLLTGVGDLADIGIKLGADLLEHGGIELASHVVEEESERVAEDEVEHVAESCASLSFSFNTLVTTSVGAKAIGTLKVGQKVWSYNPKTKKMEWEPVQHVWIDHDHDLVDLTIGWTKHTKNGDVHEDETIHTNKKHPFLTVEAGFVTVANLHVGMHLVQGDGQVGVIEDWVVIAGSETMYNLTVQQDHTYTVGDGQFVVHNIDCSDELQQLADKAESVRAIGNKAAGAAANIVTDSGEFMSDVARGPLEDFEGIVNNGIGQGGGQCAECHLAADILEHSDFGGELPDVIKIVESQRRGLDPCEACQVNLPNMLGNLGRRVQIFNANNLDNPFMEFGP